MSNVEAADVTKTAVAPETSNSQPAIALDKVGVRFGDQWLYQDLTFSVRRGEFLCIVGPSGCGKSTLLRLFGGLLEASSGNVVINGAPPSVAWQQMAYVFQAPRLAAWRSAVENVMLAGELRFDKPDKKALRTQALALLSLVGLAGDAEKFPATLSGGERQRVAIARALMVEPDIILMDEPFSALDLNTRERLRAEITAIWQRTGKTIVFVTHDVEEAVSLADRIVVLTGKPTRVHNIVDIPAQRPRVPRTDQDLARTIDNLENTMRELETHRKQASTDDKNLTTG
jgi:NitT/TauT family transport system ATP-binding protein